MSDKITNNYASQGLSYEQQVAALTKDLTTGKIDAASYINQLKALELANLKSKSDIDSKNVQLESPSDKALGDLKGVGLEALLQFITGENRSSQLKSAESRIENNKQAREANFQQTMDKINEAIKKAEDEEKSGWWKKAFGWVAKIVTAVLSVAAIVVGAITANPVLVMAGVYGCYFLASQITEEVTGKGLTARYLELYGVPEDKAIIAGGIMDCIGSIVAGCVSGSGLASAAKIADIGAKAAILCARLSYASSFVNGVAGVGTGVSGVFSAVYRYDGAKLKADEVELKKVLEKLIVEDQENQKTIKRILEFFKEMTDDVTQVIKDKAQATSNVMSMSPTGGMA